MAVVGYLLYGDGLKDELTKNMLGTAAYPGWLKVVVLVLVAVLPLTKFPLQCVRTLSSFVVTVTADKSAAQHLSSLPWRSFSASIRAPPFSSPTASTNPRSFRTPYERFSVCQSPPRQ